MHEKSDLQDALDFVIRRIEEEGMRSSELLTADQRYLLNHLPSDLHGPKDTLLTPKIRRCLYRPGI